MKSQLIHVTSSPHAMSTETNNRRFAIFNDGVDTTEVQERLDWKALRDMITIDTSILEFMPAGQIQVAALANLGAELVQEVKAYRPEFLWKRSPAEIVGALIEETSMTIPVTFSAVAIPEMWQSRVAAVKERFPAMTHQEAQNNAILSEVVDLRRVLADALAALSSSPPQPATGPTDTDMIDFLERTGSVNWDFDSCTIRIEVPDHLNSGSVREIVTAAIVAEEARA